MISFAEYLRQRAELFLLLHLHSFYSTSPVFIFFYHSIKVLSEYPTKYLRFEAYFPLYTDATTYYNKDNRRRVIFWKMKKM